VIPFLGMATRILCQGNGAISGRHYKPKPQIVTRPLQFSLASNAQTNSRLSGAMRGEVRATDSSAAAGRGNQSRVVLSEIGKFLWSSLRCTTHIPSVEPRLHLTSCSGAF
jgi:hypothetical protein